MLETRVHSHSTVGCRQFVNLRKCPGDLQHEEEGKKGQLSEPLAVVEQGC
jgi:hypothetical protein